MTENRNPAMSAEIDNRPIHEILDTIQPGEAIPVWSNFTDNTSTVATVTSDRRLCVFTNVPEEMMHPDIKEIAQSNGLTLDYRCIKTPEKEESAVEPVQDDGGELPFPETDPAIEDIISKLQPGESVPIYTTPPGSAAIANVSLTADRHLVVQTNIPDAEMRAQFEAHAKDNNLTLDYEMVEPVLDAIKTPENAAKTPVEPVNPEQGNDTPPETNAAENANLGDTEASEPINDSLSRNRLLNRMYTPEEIDILRKAANNKPTATLGDDMRRAYAPKAAPDAKVGIGDMILGAAWTILTLPVVIPWNILKASAVTVGHFANKSKNVRMAKAAVTEIPKYRKEHKAQAKANKRADVSDSAHPKQKEDDGKPKTSLIDKIKGFFSKLFQRKEEPVVEQEKAPDVADATPATETTGKKPLSELVQEAKDTPDKAPAERAPEKQTVKDAEERG